LSLAFANAIQHHICLHVKLKRMNHQVISQLWAKRQGFSSNHQYRVILRTSFLWLAIKLCCHQVNCFLERRLSSLESPYKDASNASEHSNIALQFCIVLVLLFRNDQLEGFYKTLGLISLDESVMMRESVMRRCDDERGCDNERESDNERVCEEERV
jgi:hypothetical protein